ncbi:polymerase delta-interacting protein 3 [Spea bombifrons]|uniref:polymerase delta-interacting protein 3 n=1 Tax=Spea bombifrons TaxID=233779 RepID=UPI002349D12C|nr:polymerase delta-interacting protein 3 [Spea bombifrons]
MADVSLDELIRKRGLATGTGMYSRLNSRGGTVGMRSRVQPSVPSRPVGTSFQRTFDARQKIGMTDARLKLGVKDAREKLAAKDARFRIKGKVQDAREMLNSRKQLVSAVEKPTKVMDAREKLSLKRSAPTAAVSPAVASGSSFIKLTKTIQIPQQKIITSCINNSIKGMRINVVNHQPQKQPPSQLGKDDDDDDDEEEMELPPLPTKQMKITASNTLQKRPGMAGNPFSLGQTLPLTKVVQNDSYTSPVPQPVPTTRPKTLTMSRTLVTKEEATVVQPVPSEPILSPLEGTKMTVNNLHPRVTEEDIVELFCVCGALKRARLVSPGVAEVVFVRKDDAVGAYKKYNNRYLDGQPMKCNLHLNGNIITSDQPILLRLSDTPATAKKDTEARRSSSSSSAVTNSTAEVDPDTILKALFKSSGSSAIAQPTAFKIKL